MFKPLLLLILAIQLFSVNTYAGESINDVNELRNDPPDDTYYYEYSEVEFGNGISSDQQLIDPGYEFTLTGESIKLYLMASMEEAFLTKVVYVEVYDGNNELIDSFEVDLKEEWNWFSFDLTFTEKGVYNIDIYNEIDVFINSGTVTIK